MYKTVLFITVQPPSLDSVASEVMAVPGSLRSCIGDLNDDGFDDIVQASHYTGANCMLRHPLSTGVLQMALQNLTTAPIPAESPYDCAVEDMNQDGYLDIYLPAYAGTREGFVYWGSSSAVYDTNNRTALPYVDYTTHANLEDIDLDGYPDILLGSYYKEDGAAFGFCQWVFNQQFESFNQSYIFDLAGADLNNDGLYDLVTCQYQNDAANSYDTNSAIYWNGITGFSNTFITSLQTYGCRDVETCGCQSRWL